MDLTRSWVPSVVRLWIALIAYNLLITFSNYWMRLSRNVKRVKSSADCSAILFQLPKQLNLIPRFSRSTVQKPATRLHFWRHFDIISSIWQNSCKIWSTVAGCGESETGKYFELIIRWLIKYIAHLRNGCKLKMVECPCFLQFSQGKLTMEQTINNRREKHHPTSHFCTLSQRSAPNLFPDRTL